MDLAAPVDFIEIVNLLGQRVPPIRFQWETCIIIVPVSNGYCGLCVCRPGREEGKEQEKKGLEMPPLIRFMFLLGGGVFSYPPPLNCTNTS